MLMAFSRYAVAIVLALVVSNQVASARITAIDEFDFGDLAGKSDVVVIGHVLAVKATSEQATLPDISPPTKVQGVETRFFVDSVLKGELSGHVVVLHHYKLADPGELMRNGPLLVSLVPNKYRHYLLFLKRDTDGRYVPAVGQTDAADSVRRILHAVDGLNKADAESQADRQQAQRQTQQIKESPDAPIVLTFVEMATQDGARKQARMKVTSKTTKDVYGYRLQYALFGEDGSISEVASTGVSAAVGHSVLRAGSEGFISLNNGRTDGYEITSARAVVTSVTFTDGSKWEAPK